MVFAYLSVIAVGLLSACAGGIIRGVKNQGLTPLHLTPLLGLAGTVYFAVAGAAEWHTLCWQTVVIGLVCGLTQYLPMRMFDKALNLGPLSPVWCMFCLGSFIPAIVFSAVFLGERPSLCQYFSLAAAVAVILFASQTTNAKTGEKRDLRTKLNYFLHLIGIFFFCSLLTIALKCCTREPLAHQKNLLMCFTYVAIFFFPTLEITAAKKWVFNRAFWLCCPVFAAICISEYVIMLKLVQLPATLIFAMSMTVSIAGSSLISTFVFHEKRTATWYAMLAFAIASILLNR